MNNITRIKQILNKYDSLCVAYSGGVDSDLLLHIAVQTLGKDHVLALIGTGVMMAQKDQKEAIALAEQSGAKWELVEVFPLEISEFATNQKNRCYHCKKHLMKKIKDHAQSLGFPVVADGKNADDGMQYRPGAQACTELGIISPLCDAGIGKKEIRLMAKEQHLSTWNKSSNSCLATRFPYGVSLTKERLNQAEQAELLFSSCNIPNIRVRIHQDLVRIEIPPEFFPSFLEKKEWISQLKALGFRYVTLDLEGYRSGSMDER